MTKQEQSKKYFYYVVPTIGILFSVLVAIKSNLPLGIQYINSLVLAFILGSIISVYAFFAAWFYTDYRNKIGVLRFSLSLLFAIISLIIIVSVTAGSSSTITKLFTAVIILTINLIFISVMNNKANTNKNITG